jgi:FkbM family methyltransferase
MKSSSLPKIKKLQEHFPQSNISCLDIGANCGQFFDSLKELYPQSSITMVEANPHCERFLQRKKSPYHMIALSDKKGKLEFFTTKRKPRSKGASFYPEVNWKHIKEDDILKINVEVSTLDILFENQKFDLVKIDVQGAELDIINGGTTFLQSNDLLLIEVSLIEYNQGAPLAIDVVKRLENLGFYILDCIDDHISAGETIQLDLLFSKKINAHNTGCVKEYKNVL